MNSQLRGLVLTFTLSSLCTFGALFMAGCQRQPIDHEAEIKVKFTDANFEQEVIQSDMPVLVDFSATWCGPCQMMKPIVATLSNNYEGRAKVGLLDVDDSPESASRYRITGIPAFLIFKNGEVVERIEGGREYSTLAAALEKHLNESASASL